MKEMQSLGLKYINGKLLVLDQTRLPHEEIWLESRSTEDMVGFIRRLAVRGAPLIGVAAALDLARAAEEAFSVDGMIDAARQLRAARPTAVNLMWAVDHVVLGNAPATLTRAGVIEAAQRVFEEDVALCEGMANRGAELIRDGDQILTHCNTGGLATAGVGTALGVVRRAHEQGKRIHVYVDETRPLLQGARLTAWELGKLGIPYTLICDNMAASLMAEGKVDRIFVGSDRIAANGDAANKIGTYSLAVVAHYHKVPFHVVAPRTTLDLSCPSGDRIPIEQRAPEEVRAGKAPKECPVHNPAFDVTPRSLITSIILDDRVW